MRSKPPAFATLVALAATTILVSPAEGKSGASAATATLVASGELKWVDVPGTPAKLATVKGDSARGAHVSFFMLPGGFAAPLHSHTSDHHVAVVSGTMVLTPEGGAAKKLGPGSWFEFTGKKKHLTACEAGADCVLFIVGHGTWDLVPADATGGASKK